LFTNYIEDDLDSCFEYLKLCHGMDENHYHNSNDGLIENKNLFRIYIFLDYFLFLVKYRFENKEIYNLTYDNDLYIIGESHSLSPANTIVNYKGANYKVKTNLVAGCKMWHIEQDKPSLHKYKFINSLKALPSNSNVILVVGEIDCRIDEGILKYYNSNPNIDLDLHIENMVKNYICIVDKYRKDKNLHILIHGVPASNMPLANIDIEQIDLLKHIIKIFNQQLKKASLMAKMEFIDVYSLTLASNGLSNKQFHLDDHHLFPHYLNNLLSEM
jgi:hypothetical protein